MTRSSSCPTTPMNIGVNIITSNHTPRGADRYAIALLHHLAGVDDRNRYFVFYADWQTFVGRIDHPNFHFVRLRPPGHPVLKTLWHALLFPHVVRRHGLQVIHYSNPAPILGPACPTVVTVHDVAEFTDPDKYGLLRRYVRRLSVRLSVRAAACVIAVSQSTKDALQKVVRVNPHSVAVIGEGVSLGNASPPLYTRDMPRRDHHLPPRYLLYVGVIEKTKQVEAIVRAFALLDESLQRAHALVFVGNRGNASEDVESAIRETRLEGKVSFLGHVPDEDLERLYKGASAFVYPSLAEGFGLPVLEAFAAGVPVIASDIPALSEVAGDAALLVDPRDIRALRDAIQAVLTDEALRGRLVTKGYERLKRFSWKETARQTLAVYARVAGVTRGPLG